MKQKAVELRKNFVKKINLAKNFFIHVLKNKQICSSAEKPLDDALGKCKRLSRACAE